MGCDTIEINLVSSSYCVPPRVYPHNLSSLFMSPTLLVKELHLQSCPSHPILLILIQELSHFLPLMWLLSQPKDLAPFLFLLHLGGPLSWSKPWPCGSLGPSSWLPPSALLIAPRCLLSSHFLTQSGLQEMQIFSYTTPDLVQSGLCSPSWLRVTHCSLPYWSSLKIYDWANSDLMLPGQVPGSRILGLSFLVLHFCTKGNTWLTF